MLCGGDGGFFFDVYWLFRHVLSKDGTICPRCGYSAFQHGFIPRERYYCTVCHLWEPLWMREGDR